MNTSKPLAYFIIILISINSWWYYAVFASAKKSPFILLPLSSTLFLVAALVAYIFENWEN